MLRTTSRTTRRIHFYATVLAVETQTGVTRRDAFRSVNTTHPTLRETFVNVGAFEDWIVRNRVKLRSVTEDSSEIPTVWDDALPIGRGVDVPDALSVTANRAGFVADREADQDRRAFLKRMMDHYDVKACNDPTFRRDCVRLWVEAQFPRDTC